MMHRTVGNKWVYLFRHLKSSWRLERTSVTGVALVIAIFTIRMFCMRRFCVVESFGRFFFVTVVVYAMFESLG